MQNKPRNLKRITSDKKTGANNEFKEIGRAHV